MRNLHWLPDVRLMDPKLNRLIFHGSIPLPNQRERFVLPSPKTNIKLTSLKMDGWIRGCFLLGWPIFWKELLVSGSVLSIMDSSSFSRRRRSMNLFASLVPKHSFFFIGKFRSPNEAHCLWFVLVWYLETHKSSCWIIWTVWRNTLSH